MTKRPFGDKLHTLRIERRLTLKDVNKSIGISMMFLSEIEGGEKSPSAEMLEKLCNFYKVDRDEMNALLQRQKMMSQIDDADVDDPRMRIARSVFSMRDDAFNELEEFLNNRHQREEK